MPAGDALLRPVSLAPVSLMRPLAALLAGGLSVLAFAPFSVFVSALFGPLLLFLFWLRASPGQAFVQGWCYGFGLLSVGVFWMHISIDQFGNIGTPGAIALTLLFVAAMALYYGLVGWLAVRLGGRVHQGLRLLLLFPALWVLGEWLRGWFLSGFPWLSLGYSQIDSPLAGYAPVLGVYGVSLAVVMLAGFLALAFTARGWRRLGAVAAVLLVGVTGQVLSGLEWTRSQGDPLRVSLIQGNVAQHEKWRRENLLPTLGLYTGLTGGEWESDLIIWPETAIPSFAHLVEESLLQPLSVEAVQRGSQLLVGVPVWEEGRYYNAMLSLGVQREAYHKRHLVPFGEFMPFKGLLAPLLTWMNVPMSDFSAGEGKPPLLTLAGYPAGISICYEDAFGDEVAEALPQAAFLINASNDAWFGDSLAPHQHLEIARMRALETGRYLLRSTNTGVSAVIDPRGRILGQSPAFEQHVLRQEIRPMAGLTPYGYAGNGSLVLLCLASLGLSLLPGRRRG
jgi:apolipoprotein N-acyltransferase